MRHAASGDCSKTPTPRRSALLDALSFAGTVGIILAVVFAVVFVARLAWKGW